MVVDREMRALTDTLVNALSDPQAHPVKSWNVRLWRCSPTWRRTPKVSACSPAIRRKPIRPARSIRFWETSPCAWKTFSPKRSNASICRPRGVPYYAQMLIGMTVYTCQYWADQRRLSKEQLAAHIVNLAWHGLSRMEAKPELRFESDKATKEAEKQERREIKEIAKRERKAAKEAQSQNNTESPAEQNAEQNTEQGAAGSQKARKPNSSRKTQPHPVIVSIAAHANRRPTQESNSTSNRGIASIAQANKHRRKLTNRQQRYP